MIDVLYMIYVCMIYDIWIFYDICMYVCMYLGRGKKKKWFFPTCSKNIPKITNILINMAYLWEKYYLILRKHTYKDLLGE
jgi:hypothetical protein